jgi:uncharacterized membrane protein YhdT
MEDKYSTNYDIAKIKLDPRFILCRNDMITVECVYIGSILLVFMIAYLLSPTDPGKMKYLFGYPFWVTICTIINLLDVIFVIVWAMKRKRFSLDAKSDN